MTISSRRAFAFALVASMAFVAPSASAQSSEPSAPDLASARELYREAKELRQNGDLRGALERFKAAHALGQTPVTGVELGKTHLQLGELVEAREVFLSIGRIKVASDETEKSADARQEAERLAEELRPRIPTLVVRVSGSPRAAETKVVIDGANTPLVEGAAMRKVDPGTHTVVARAGGREVTSSVTLAEGETKEVPIPFTAMDQGAEASTESRRPAAEERRSIHVLTWIGLGVGAAGLAAGAVTGIMALGKANAVGDACHGLECPASARSDVEDGRTVANVSTISLAVGGAGIAAAAIGFFVLSPHNRRAGTTPQVTLAPTWAGIHGSF